MTRRTVATASILAIGTELTTGSTRDTNSGDLARELVALGLAVERMIALPDDLAAVTDALRHALTRADLVLVTGGLGPTPDDLTREAIAAACHETPSIDPALERTLRAMFERRGLEMPVANLKQAWRIPSADGLPNPLGSAPGWWVERPDGALIVALPGPPGEMRPMWRDEVVPRLRRRGVGADRASVTWRLTGIGESALADLIGEARLRATNPVVATYARSDAVDVRISAVGEDGRPAVDHVAAVEAGLEPLIARYRFARGEETWIDALTARLAGRRLAVVEIGTGGQLGALLAAAPWFAFGEILKLDSPLGRTHLRLEPYASRVRQVAEVEVGVAVRARERGADTGVTVVTDVEGRIARVTRTALLTGEAGRRRASVVAAAELWRRLGETTVS